MESEFSVCKRPHFLASDRKNDNALLMFSAFFSMSSFCCLCCMLPLNAVVIENGVMDIQLGPGLIQHGLGNRHNGRGDIMAGRKCLPAMDLSIHPSARYNPLENTPCCQERNHPARDAGVFRRR
ncbi:hypothetical protein, partial [Komagataeibacter europaeus]